MKSPKRYQVKFFEGEFNNTTQDQVNSWLDNHRSIDIVNPIWFNMISDTTFKAVMIYREVINLIVL